MFFLNAPNLNAHLSSIEQYRYSMTMHTHVCSTFSLMIITVCNLRTLSLIYRLLSYQRTRIYGRILSRISETELATQIQSNSVYLHLYFALFIHTPFHWIFVYFSVASSMLIDSIWARERERKKKSEIRTGVGKTIKCTFLLLSRVCFLCVIYALNYNQCFAS